MDVRIRFDVDKPLEMIRGRDLVPNPFNWRTHPVKQADALRGILAEVGIADVVKGYRLPDGRVQTIDGHLRAEILPDQEIPVLMLDVTEEEAQKLLATFDSVGELAEVDQERLRLLLTDMSFQNDAVNQMLADLAAQNDVLLGDGGLLSGSDGSGDGSGEQSEVKPCWDVIVACETEQEQIRLIRILMANNFKFKPMVV